MKGNTKTINPEARLLGSEGHVIASINRYGTVRLFSARDEIEGDNGNGIAGVIPTQEILMQCTAAERLRDILLEWFPIEQESINDETSPGGFPVFGGIK